MKLKKLSILPAALALSLMMAPVAFAGEGKNGGGDHDGGGEHEGGGKNGGGPAGPPGPPGPPGPAGPSGGHGTPQGGGSGVAGIDKNFACRVGNRMVYVGTRHHCEELRFAIGFGGSKRRSASVAVQGGGYATGGGYVSGGGVIADGDYGYYQPQRVIRYVAKPSRAARMQMEKRARKAARRAAAAGYGMVGYGNGVMVGGYGNSVLINGNVYAGNGYAYSGQQVVVSKKRKGRKVRRVVVQQPQYYVDPGLAYGGGYGYDGSVMVKGGGY
jgi:hypothetical protein